MVGDLCIDCIFVENFDCDPKIIFQLAKNNSHRTSHDNAQRKF